MNNIEWGVLVSIWAVGYGVFRLEIVLLRIETLLKQRA